MKNNLNSLNNNVSNIDVEEYRKMKSKKLNDYLKTIRHYNTFIGLCIGWKNKSKDELKNYGVFKIGFMNYVIVESKYWEQMYREGYKRIGDLNG